MRTLHKEAVALRAECGVHLLADKTNEEGEAGSAVVALSEATKAMLETAFTSNLANPDRRKRADKFGVPDCDAIRSRTHQPAIKVDGYLSRLHLNPEKATTAVQSALVLMGNAHQHMVQESANECQPGLENHGGGGEGLPKSRSYAFW